MRTRLTVLVDTDDDAYETTYGSRPDHEHGDEVKANVEALLAARSPFDEWAKVTVILNGRP